ncbi:NYN domain-containing protein [Candidatus Parcubacteria bacterium]|nr:NYN domain-containing protein [Candidatus Parcubacteria bacterium]
MTVIKHKAQRVGIFIDTANIYHSAKNLYHAKANFGAIIKDALDGRVLVRAIAYVATTEGGEEKAFFDALGKVGIETRTKPLQIFAGGAKKANWDIDFAMDAVKLAPKLDTTILITGDGDMVSLVEYLQNTHGMQVEVVSFGKSSSAKLIEAADDFLDLDSNPKKYLIAPRTNVKWDNARRSKPTNADAAPAAGGDLAS